MAIYTYQARGGDGTVLETWTPDDCRWPAPRAQTAAKKTGDPGATVVEMHQGKDVGIYWQATPPSQPMPFSLPDPRCVGQMETAFGEIVGRPEHLRVPAERPTLPASPD